MKRFLCVYHKACNILFNALVAVCGVAVLLMMILVAIDIVGRNTSLFRTIAASELSGYLLVLVVFFGMAYTLKDDGFIRVTVLYGKFTGKVKYSLDILINLIALAFCSFLLYYSWKMVALSFVQKVVSQGILQVPIWLPQVTIVLGTAVTLLFLIGNILDAIAGLAGMEMGKEENEIE